MSPVPDIPHLRRCANTKLLIVHGEPFLMLGGELQNSSLSSAEYMDEVWPKMVSAHVNTVLGAVTWEMIEPREGEFDFQELDKVILGARKHNLHLILLWFGSWKNGKSTYVPSWIKTNPSRFPRAELRNHGGDTEVADVLSLFHEQNIAADARAFRNLLDHLNKFDGHHHTVLMVQVENEVGLLSDSRDRSEKAESKFAESVPSELLYFLRDDYERLHPDLKTTLATFAANNKPVSGTWAQVFGESLQTDELFMAYYYALYVNRVAIAGKKAYPLPMYTNVWQNYVGNNSGNDFPIIAGGGGQPGDYPSGGATSSVLDVWLKFASSLDFIAPDIYLNEYTALCTNYRHKDNPLFIPEQRRDEHGARRIWAAYGTFQGLLTSPFGIDTLDPDTNPFTKHYRLLNSVSKLVLGAQQVPGNSFGFYFDELPSTWKNGSSDPPETYTATFHEWILTIDRCFVFGKPGPGCGMVIQTGEARFILIGWGFQVTGNSRTLNKKFEGILKFEEKVWDKENQTLKTVRTLGGDETRSGRHAMMPNEYPDYGGFPIAVTIPARTGIAQVEFYAF